jgi:hypothetical protein
MMCSSRTTAHSAGNDLRQHEAIRLLIGSDSLSSERDEEFWIRLKFVIQARELGLSLADVRQLLAADPSSPPATRAGRIANAYTSTTVAS